MNPLVHPAIHAERLRRMREAAENSLKQYPESERREAARRLGIEHYLPAPQAVLPLQPTSGEP